MDYQSIIQQFFAVFDKSIKDKSTMKGNSIIDLFVGRNSWLYKWLNNILSMLVCFELVSNLAIPLYIYNHLDTCNIKDFADVLAIAVASIGTHVFVTILYIEYRVKPLWGSKNISRNIEVVKNYRIIKGLAFSQCVISGLVLCIAIWYTCLSGDRTICDMILCCCAIIVSTCLFCLIVFEIVRYRYMSIDEKECIKCCCYTRDVEDFCIEDDYVPAETGIRIVYEKKSFQHHEDSKINLTKCSLYTLGENKIVIDYDYPIILDESEYDYILVSPQSGSRIRYKYRNGILDDLDNISCNRRL